MKRLFAVILLLPLWAFARTPDEYQLLPMNLGRNFPNLQYYSIGTTPKRNFVMAEDLFPEIPMEKKLYIVFSNIHTMLYFDGMYVEGLGDIFINIRSSFVPGKVLGGDFAVMVDELTDEQSANLYRLIYNHPRCRALTCTQMTTRFLEQIGIGLGANPIYTSSGLAKHLVHLKAKGRDLRFISLNGADPARSVRTLRSREVGRLSTGYGLGAVFLGVACATLLH